MKRLPRRLALAGYRVDVLLVSQTVLREEFEDEEGGVYEGGWFPDFRNDRSHGRILILQTLPLAKKWFVFWHEVLHAVNDLRDWDMETQPIQ